MAKKKADINNGLAEAVLGNGLPFGPFEPQSGVQLSQWNTLFRNLRWYLISNNRQLLSQAYAEFGLVQALVDVPVNDAMRGGVEIKSADLDEEDVKKLQIWLKRDAILRKVVGQSAKWNRLYGGAGIVTMTNQNPKEPLDIKKIKPDSPLFFRAADLWELFSNMQNVGEMEEGAILDPLYYDYYDMTLHNSWVMPMRGIEPPSFLRPRLRGWGFCVMECVVRSINQYLKATDLSFEVLDEFKLDIFKIKGMNAALATSNGQSKIRERVQIANAQKNYQNALTMDMDDDYMQKQLSFAGLADTMNGIRMQVASDLRMPMSKLFGIPSTGFSSGEDDIENYNAMVESDIREKVEFDILKILELKCQQLFGFVPEDLEIDFRPLRVLSAEQEENVKTQKFTRIMQARQIGEMDSKEFKDAVNKDNLVGVQLDTSRDTLPPPGQVDAEGASPAADSGGKSTIKAKEAKV